MIARDEESNVAAAITSAIPLVDEVIFIDTGSKDKTWEIVSNFRGQTNMRMFQQVWQDNFSLHRNSATDYASCDYILVLDADEELVIATGAGNSNEILDCRLTYIKTRLRGLPCIVDTHHVSEDTVVDSDKGLRLFPRSGFHYRFRAHNLLVDKDENPPLSLIQCPHWFHIRHYGYTRDRLRRKSERTLRLLLMDAAENKPLGLTQYYLAREYYMRGNFSKALEHWEKAARLGENASAAILGVYKLQMAPLYKNILRVMHERPKETRIWLP